MRPFTAGKNGRIETMSLSPVQRCVLRWVWAVAVCFVVIGSLLPGSSPLLGLIGHLTISDKILHFSAYLILALLPMASFEHLRRGILAGAFMVLLGMALEGGQSLAPGRQVEVADMLANGLGVMCGIALGLPLRP